MLDRWLDALQCQTATLLSVETCLSICIPKLDLGFLSVLPGPVFKHSHLETWLQFQGADADEGGLLVVIKQ